MDEGLLYQRIMHVPGLSGTWQQRLAQYYKALTGKTYKGSLSEGLYMLDQISKRNFPQAPGWGQPAPTPAPAPAPTPVATPVSAGTSAGQEAKRDPWESVMPWGQYFDENLVRSSEAARAARYFDPLIQRGREGIEGEYAQRGLTRSGARTTDIMRMYEDMRDEEEKMREQLYGTRLAEAKGDYGNLQSLYESNAKGFKPSTYSYTPYEYEAPSESPYKYASTYRQWLNNLYK